LDNERLIKDLELCGYRVALEAAEAIKRLTLQPIATLPYDEVVLIMREDGAMMETFWYDESLKEFLAKGWTHKPVFWMYKPLMPVEKK